jgi:hypothetical protein
MSIIPFLSKTSFDPELTAVLASAFDIAWQRVQKSGSPLASAEAAAATREMMAKKIIAAAQSGERDENRLVESALSSLTLPAQGRQAAPT